MFLTLPIAIHLLQVSSNKCDNQDENISSEKAYDEKEKFVKEGKPYTNASFKHAGY